MFGDVVGKMNLSRPRTGATSETDPVKTHDPSDGLVGAFGLGHEFRKRSMWRFPFRHRGTPSHHPFLDWDCPS